MFLEHFCWQACFLLPWVLYNFVCLDSLGAPTIISRDNVTTCTIGSDNVTITSLTASTLSAALSFMYDSDG